VLLVFLGGSWCNFCISRLKALTSALGERLQAVTVTLETGP
jgi:hypothetical protein